MNVDQTKGNSPREDRIRKRKTAVTENGGRQGTLHLTLNEIRTSPAQENARRMLFRGSLEKGKLDSLSVPSKKSRKSGGACEGLKIQNLEELSGVSVQRGNKKVAYWGRCSPWKFKPKKKKLSGKTGEEEASRAWQQREREDRFL